MRVQDLMTTAVHTVTPATPADAAWELMQQKGVHHLVVKEGSAVVGLLSERDIGGRRGTSIRSGRTARDLMTARVVTLRPTATVRQAANLMRGRSIGSLVITDLARVVGILTVTDLLEAIGRGIDRPVTGTRWTLKHRAPHRKRHAATGAW